MPSGTAAGYGPGGTLGKENLRGRGRRMLRRLIRRYLNVSLSVGQTLLPTTPGKLIAATLMFVWGAGPHTLLVPALTERI